MGMRARSRPDPVLHCPRRRGKLRFLPATKKRGQCSLLPPEAPGDPRVATPAVLVVLMAAGLLAGSTPAAASEVLGGIDMQRACNTQYYDAFHIRAVVLDEHDAYSWRCVQDADTTNGIDMGLACTIQYGRTARAGLAFWWDPHSWYCLQ